MKKTNTVVGHDIVESSVKKSGEECHMRGVLRWFNNIFNKNSPKSSEKFSALTASVPRLYNVQCAMHNVECTMYTGKCTTDVHM
jgi:hypothetical protein